MGSFIVGRALQGFVAVIGISTALFFLQRASGNPAAILCGENCTPEQLAAIERSIGLDQPLPVQYALFMGNLVTFGRLSCVTIETDS
jgi:peptide/nickel transport system permease protein